MSAIRGEYVQLQTYKEKPYVTLHIDFPEEMADEIIRTIGWPKKGESVWVAVALLDKSIINKGAIDHVPVVTKLVEKPEGEKMRMQAGIYGTDANFAQFVFEGFFISGILHQATNVTSEGVVAFIRQFCGIKSRKELLDNEGAQKKFRELQSKFKDWEFERKYSENLSR